MPNEATVTPLPDFAISDYALIDLTTLPKNYPAQKRQSAEIVNFEIAQRSYRIEKFTDAIERDPQSALACFNRGLALLDAKDYRRAIEDFSRAISLDENNPQFYNARGSAYFYLNRKDDALKEFECIDYRFGHSSAAMQREEVAKALFNQAQTLTRLLRYQHAFAVYDDLIKRFGLG